MPNAFSPNQHVEKNIITVLAEFGVALKVDEATESRLADIAINNGSQLENDSRKLNAGDVFCATIGHQQDGRDFVSAAIKAKASVVIAQCEHAEQHGQFHFEQHPLENTEPSAEQYAVMIVQFYQLNTQLFALAKSYYQAPQDKLRIVGVTGTNGKTTISQIIAQLYTQVWKISSASEKQLRQCAVIGTTGAGLLTQLTPVINTTPGAIELHQLFYRFAEQGISHVAMEVSSHALVQQRVTASLFQQAIFSNLSHDHLDYHHSMDNYAAAKFSLFSQEPSQTAIINGDDKYAKTWLKTLANHQPVIVYGREKNSEQHSQYVQAVNIKHYSAGSRFTLKTHLGDIDCDSRLIGDFNIDNLLAGVALLLSEGYALNDIASAITKVEAVAGRMEVFSHDSAVSNNLPTTIVDYAHTPDALENALKACRQHNGQPLWVVFGCGGERDQSKRPLMGAIAETLADNIIVTNDNPRSEQPEDIANQIINGCKNKQNIQVLLNREDAIKYALTHAHSNDTVLVAGKGHEQNIIMANEVIAYDEREFIRQIYQTEAIS